MFFYKESGETIEQGALLSVLAVRRVGQGNFTPSPSQNRT